MKTIVFLTSRWRSSRIVCMSTRMRGSGEQVGGAEEARRQLFSYVEPPMREDIREALDEFVAIKREVYSSAA